MKKAFTIILVVLCFVVFSEGYAGSKTRKRTTRKTTQVITNYHIPIGVKYYSTHEDAHGNSAYFYMENDTEGNYVTEGGLVYDFKVISKKGNLIMEWKSDLGKPGEFWVYRYIGTVTVNPSDNTVKTYKRLCHYMKEGAKRAAMKFPFEFNIYQ